MATRLIVFLRISVFCSLTFSINAYSPQPGDTLDIQVINKKELNTKQQISPDGTISLPLVGRFSVKTKSLEDIDAELKVEYSKYLQNPVLSVQVDQVKKGVSQPSGNFFVSLVDPQKGTIEVKITKTLPEAMAWTGGYPFQVYRYSETAQKKILVGPKDTFASGDTLVVSLSGTKSPPIYVVFKDLSKNTVDLKKAESLSEAMAWIAGQRYELRKGATGTPSSETIEPGDTIILTVGKPDDWWEDNWYKVLSGAAVAMGLWNSINR